ncbi:MAG: hypothetical protein WCO07_01565 [bacterium]
MDEDFKFEQRKIEMINEWYECYQKQVFPKGLNVVWKDWRDFWDYWYLHPDLRIEEAFTVFLMNREKEIIRKDEENKIKQNIEETNQ